MFMLTLNKWGFQLSCWRAAILIIEKKLCFQVVCFVLQKNLAEICRDFNFYILNLEKCWPNIEKSKIS